MKYPPMEDILVEIEPEMPAMGHGSEGNVNPSYDFDGLYSGKVYFNMTGFWRIHVRLKTTKGDSLGETFFDLTF